MKALPGVEYELFNEDPFIVFYSVYRIYNLWNGRADADKTVLL